MAKGTGNTSQTLIINGREHIIPLELLSLSILPLLILYHAIGEMIHLFFGQTVGSMGRPLRFEISNSQPSELWQPVPGSFLPWSLGPRICPGKKFAQVEFIAVLCVLFRFHRVKPVLQKGETQQEASKRLLRAIDDSDMR
jgi:hypothetical protein